MAKLVLVNTPKPHKIFNHQIYTHPTRLVLLPYLVIKKYEKGTNQVQINLNVGTSSQNNCRYKKVSMQVHFFLRALKKPTSVGFIVNWHPVGESNPCCRDENPVSQASRRTGQDKLCIIWNHQRLSNHIILIFS